MTYRVEFTARASRDLEFLYEEKNAAESRAAARWFNGLALETRCCDEGESPPTDLIQSQFDRSAGLQETCSN
jgi:hypothetical protein